MPNCLTLVIISNPVVKPDYERYAILHTLIAVIGIVSHQQYKFSCYREKRSKRRVLETVQEFSLVCRGLIGTEYARQTLASKQLVA